jgi:hypothetical protein
MCSWRAPKSLVRPKEGPTMSNCESRWDLVLLLTSSTKGGWEARAGSSGIRLGRGSSYLVIRSCIQIQPRGLVHILEHFWCWDKSQATHIHLIHHGPDSGEATTFLHIVFTALLRRTYIRMSLFPETPKVESWNCPNLHSRDFGHP